MKEENFALLTHSIGTGLLISIFTYLLDSYSTETTSKLFWIIIMIAMWIGITIAIISRWERG